MIRPNSIYFLAHQLVQPSCYWCGYILPTYQVAAVNRKMGLIFKSLLVCPHSLKYGSSCLSSSFIWKMICFTSNKTTLPGFFTKHLDLKIHQISIWLSTCKYLISMILCTIKLLIMSQFAAIFSVVITAY